MSKNGEPLKGSPFFFVNICRALGTLKKVVNLFQGSVFYL